MKEGVPKLYVEIKNANHFWVTKNKTMAPYWGAFFQCHLMKNEKACTKVYGNE